MLVIKNCGWKRLMIVFLAGLLGSCGFTPPGPRALLKGEKLVQQGKFEQALESLQTAVRLLPKNAQAWNYLGLAYHGARQPAPAQKAYAQALALDHKLAAARFNLGCLYLEQNDFSQAIEQLTTFTLIEPRSTQGFLKLASAQLRARRVDLAERYYKTVLDLQPREPEALNGLGVIAFQRRRMAEAQNHFTQALAQASNYPPALLNSALVAQQGFGNKTGALQKYRQYLALQPRLENWAAVSALAAQLETELKPPPEPLVLKPASLPPSRTNPPHPQTAMAARVVASNPAPFLAAARTNVSGVKTTLLKTPVLPPTNTGLVSIPAAARTSNPPSAPLLPTNKMPDLEVTQVHEDLIIKPAQEVSHATSPGAAVEAKEPAPVQSPSGVSFQSADTKPEKRGLFSRLNPFNNRPKSQPGPIVVSVASNEVKEIKPATTTSAEPRVVPKYNFLSPSPPAPGNRAQAEPYFRQAVKAQQARQFARALTDYQKAIQLDPAYLEAYYNQGLAAYELGITKTALTAFEYALALKPNFTDARYNFALALKQNNYLLDAVDQLQKILDEHPADVRAHLSLGNLRAQKLNQPALAREHYMQVLKNAPEHPNAAEIRYWLAAHP